MKSTKKIKNLKVGELFKTSYMDHYVMFIRSTPTNTKNELLVEYYYEDFSSIKLIKANSALEVNILKNQKTLIKPTSIKNNPIIAKSEKDIILKQKKLQNRIKDLGINYVFCGNCREEIFYDVNDKKSRCVHCFSKIVPSACPEVFFDGCEEDYDQKVQFIKDTISWIHDYKIDQFAYRITNHNLFTKIVSILAEKQLNLINNIIK
jgi:DNA-directed RNA polymerase subunit RPC12/RpoP